jgi:MFS family permease
MLFVHCSQWEFVCDDAFKTKLVQSFFMGGVGIGAVTLGTVADNFGRRKTLAGTLIGMIIFGLLSSFVPWFSFYLGLRLVISYII